MFTWDFSTHKKHSPTWYIIAIIIVLSFIVYGIIEGIYTMSLASFLFAGVYILMENNHSPITSVQIDESGIRVGSVFYSYASIGDFSIITIDDRALYLRITPRKKISVVIDIPFIQDLDVVAIQSFLNERIEEKKDVKFSNTDAFIHIAGL